MLLQYVPVHTKPSPGSDMQCLPNITYLVPMCVSLLMFSVSWRRILTCCACVLCHRAGYIVSCTLHNIHAQQVNIRRHDTDNFINDRHVGTRYVILAKHCISLPDDGFVWTETCWRRFYNLKHCASNCKANYWMAIDVSRVGRVAAGLRWREHMEKKAAIFLLVILLFFLVGLKITQWRVEICCPDNIRFYCIYK